MTNFISRRQIFIPSLPHKAASCLSKTTEEVLNPRWGKRFFKTKCRNRLDGYNNGNRGNNQFKGSKEILETMWKNESFPYTSLREGSNRLLHSMYAVKVSPTKKKQNHKEVRAYCKKWEISVLVKTSWMLQSLFHSSTVWGSNGITPAWCCTVPG